jgi:hypothetical protein
MNKEMRELIQAKHYSAFDYIEELEDAIRELLGYKVHLPDLGTYDIVEVPETVVHSIEALIDDTHIQN